MAEERDLLDEPDRCEALVGIIECEDVSGPEGQGLVRRSLEQIGTRCGGAPGVAGLVAAALSLLETGLG